MTDFRPTTEIEKLHMKRKFIELANRMKCRYIDHGSWIAVEIRPMTQIKKEVKDAIPNTAETSEH